MLGPEARADDRGAKGCLGGPQATPAGWYVGRPSYHDERREWFQHAYDPRERPSVGLRSREWTAIGTTELEVVAEMARCLREIKEGRTPS